jgi:hypothetical protein
MGFKRGIKGFFKRGWSVRSWVQADNLKQEHQFIKGLAKTLVSQARSKDQSEEVQDYQEIVNDNGYSDTQIESMKKRSRLLFWCYIVFALLLVAYMLRMFYVGSFISGVCSISMILLVMACAFKESFFVFCLKKKSFQQTFSAWLQQWTGGGEKI